VAGAQYPPEIDWPANVERLEHVGPHDHAMFYNSSRWTLNVTRADMIAAGWSPSVRLFEAAATQTPVISDRWEGLDHLFAPEREIVLADDSDAVLRRLRAQGAEAETVGAAARARVLAEHTNARRAEQLERNLQDIAR
jgi:spore maturation protein CgeB